MNLNNSIQQVRCRGFASERRLESQRWLLCIDCHQPMHIRLDWTTWRMRQLKRPFVQSKRHWGWTEHIHLWPKFSGLRAYFLKITICGCVQSSRYSFVIRCSKLSTNLRGKNYDWRLTLSFSDLCSRSFFSNWSALSCAASFSILIACIFFLIASIVFAAMFDER